MQTTAISTGSQHAAQHTRTRSRSFSRSCACPLRSVCVPLVVGVLLVDVLHVAAATGHVALLPQTSDIDLTDRWMLLSAHHALLGQPCDAAVQPGKKTAVTPRVNSLTDAACFWQCVCLLCREMTQLSPPQQISPSNIPWRSRISLMRLTYAHHS